MRMEGRNLEIFVTCFSDTENLTRPCIIYIPLFKCKTGLFELMQEEKNKLNREAYIYEKKNC